MLMRSGLSKFGRTLWVAMGQSVHGALSPAPYTSTVLSKYKARLHSIGRCTELNPETSPNRFFEPLPFLAQHATKCHVRQLVKHVVQI